MYRNTRFTLPESCRVGRSTNWARRPIVNDMSGRVATARYIRHPIACLYRIESNGSPSTSAIVIWSDIDEKQALHESSQSALEPFRHIAFGGYEQLFSTYRDESPGRGRRKPARILPFLPARRIQSSAIPRIRDHLTKTTNRRQRENSLPSDLSGWNVQTRVVGLAFDLQNFL